ERGRDAATGGGGCDTEADRKKRCGGFLSRRNGANAGRGYAGAGRPDHDGGPRRIPAQGAAGTASEVRLGWAQLGSDFVPTAELGRRGRDRSLEHARIRTVERLAGCGECAPGGGDDEAGVR